MIECRISFSSLMRASSRSMVWMRSMWYSMRDLARSPVGYVFMVVLFIGLVRVNEHSASVVPFAVPSVISQLFSESLKNSVLVEI